MYYNGTNNAIFYKKIVEDQEQNFIHIFEGIPMYNNKISSSRRCGVFVKTKIVRTIKWARNCQFMAKNVWHKWPKKPKFSL